MVNNSKVVVSVNNIDLNPHITTSNLVKLEQELYALENKEDEKEDHIFYYTPGSDDDLIIQKVATKFSISPESALSLISTFSSLLIHIANTNRFLIKDVDNTDNIEDFNRKVLLALLDSMVEDYKEAKKEIEELFEGEINEDN